MILAVVNVAATLLVVAALIRSKARKVDRTEEGRAVLVLLATFLTSSAAGLSRRLGLSIADEAALASWTAVAAAATWVLLHHREVDSSKTNKE